MGAPARSSTAARRSRSSSLAPGSASTPLSSSTTNGRGATAPNANRVRRRADGAAQAEGGEVDAAPAGEPARTSCRAARRARGSSTAVAISPRPQVGGPRPEHEVAHRHPPLPRPAAQHDLGVVDEQRGRGVVRRGGVADVPGQRRPVADLHRADRRGRLDQRREPRAHPLVGDDVGQRGRRRDRQAVADHRDARRQVGEVLEVDDELGPHLPALQPDDQVGAARRSCRTADGSTSSSRS